MSEAARILVVEDERSMREVLAMLLESEGYEVVAAADGAEGVARLRDGRFDLVITDLKMPGATGFDVLSEAQDAEGRPRVIMITAFGTVESGIEAMKRGACDFINKPFKIDEIRLIVRKALDRPCAPEAGGPGDEDGHPGEIYGLIGRSEQMLSLLKMLPRVAQGRSNVLITGESGTGKELVAAAIHRLSPRSGNAFVPINCSAIPEPLLESELFGHVKGSFTGASQQKPGLFEVADGGTLFMDEIAEMPMNLQSKLLRAIEYGTFRRVGGTEDLNVNVLIVTATNRDLRREVKEGRFREDLYFRLNVIPLHIAPLRERKEDIPTLLDYFAARLSPGQPHQFSGSALSVLMHYDWPGNVRELKSTVERILLLCESSIITEADLPPDLLISPVRREEPSCVIPPGMDLEKTMAETEIKYLTEALKSTGGNKTEAAKLLGLTFRSFRHKLSKHGIK